MDVKRMAKQESTMAAIEIDLASDATESEEREASWAVCGLAVTSRAGVQLSTLPSAQTGNKKKISIEYKKRLLEGKA